MVAFNYIKDSHTETEFNLSCMKKRETKKNWWEFQDGGLTLYKRDLINNHSCPKLVEDGSKRRSDKFQPYPSHCSSA